MAASLPLPMRALELIAWWLWKTLLAIFIIVLCLVAAFDVQDAVGRGLISLFAFVCFLLLIFTEPDV